MTSGDTSNTRSDGDEQRHPLILQSGGLSGAVPLVVAAAVVGLFTAGTIAAIVNGKLLWLTIPLALILGLALLAVLSGVRNSAIPRGLIVDAKGIHSTLKGKPTSSFPWATIEAAGISYMMVATGEYGTKRPRRHDLDIFCATAQLETPMRAKRVGQPQRVSDEDETPLYGAQDGHIRIPVDVTKASKRNALKASISAFGGSVLIDDFERPYPRTPRRNRAS